MFQKIKSLTFRRSVALLLIVILGFLAVFSIPSLIVLIKNEILAEPMWLMNVEKIRAVLDLVLWILIVVELMDSVRVYLEEKGLHLETVLSIALVAMARKIIAVRLRDYEPIMVLGMAALFIGLGITYYLVRKSRAFPGGGEKQE
ncbi:MAG: phosphate-starvation-inducible PsiE family protein [Chloroflexota bacterium]